MMYKQKGGSKPGYFICNSWLHSPRLPQMLHTLRGNALNNMKNELKVLPRNGVPFGHGMVCEIVQADCVFLLGQS